LVVVGEMEGDVDRESERAAGRRWRGVANSDTSVEVALDSSATSSSGGYE
jgi:hypothetical protein